MDDFTPEAIAIEVGQSIPGARVVRVLEQISKGGGLPRSLVVDNSPKFTNRVLDQSPHRRER